MSKARALFLLVLIVQSPLACRKDKTTTDQPGAPATAAPEQPTEPPSVRGDHHVVRSLLEEMARAELSAGGLFVNLGTPEQHKYTRGGWKSGWAAAHADADGLYVDAEKTAQLFLHLWRPGTKEIVVRARSAVAGQKLTLYAGKRAVATRPLDSNWKALHYDLGTEGLPAGRQALTLSFTAPGQPAAQVDWVWLRHQGAPARPPEGVKAATRSFGQPRRALIADPPRRLSFYLAVPDDSALIFDYGAEGRAEFQVWAHADGQASKKLFDAPAGKRWREAKVDLGELAGKLVRLELVTSGTASKAAWGEPDLVRKGVAPDPPVVSRANRAKNLVYILIDTARQDRFRGFGNETRVTTPRMDRFLSRATAFTNAYVNDNWTKPSCLTALAGVYSSTHGTQGQASVVPEEVGLVSEHLKRQHFATGAFIANGFVSDKFGFKRGWDSWRNYIRENLKKTASAVYGDAAKWLEQRDPKQRFFLYIQTIDPHVTYETAEKYWRPYYDRDKYTGPLGDSVTGHESKKIGGGKIKLTEDDRNWIRALYDAEISYHDEYFGKFLDKLDAMGLTKDTLVVVTNDHGEEMFDHEKLGHGHSLYEDMIRDPLAIRLPGLVPAGHKVVTPVELVDVLPTVLELLGAQPMAQAEGTSLLGLMHGRFSPTLGYAVAEFGKHMRAVRVGNFKMITTAGKPQLFDVVADRAEQTDLVDSHPIARRACEAYLGEALAVPNKRWRLRGIKRRQFRSPEVKIDDDLRKQLEALGYING